MVIAEACEAFNKTLLHFVYTQNIEVYDPKIHQVNPPHTHPFYQIIDFSSKILLNFNYSYITLHVQPRLFSSSFCDAVVAEHVV